jgi:hypothetical protein
LKLHPLYGLGIRRQAHHGAPKPAVIHILKGLVFAFEWVQRAKAHCYLLKFFIKVIFLFLPNISK